MDGGTLYTISCKNHTLTSGVLDAANLQWPPGLDTRGFAMCHQLWMPEILEHKVKFLESVLIMALKMAKKNGSSFRQNLSQDIWTECHAIKAVFLYNKVYVYKYTYIYTKVHFSYNKFEFYVQRLAIYVI